MNRFLSAYLNILVMLLFQGLQLGGDIGSNGGTTGYAVKGTLTAGMNQEAWRPILILGGLYCHNILPQFPPCV